MLIRFLRDFRSAATGERFYQAGDEADVERGAEVVAEGAAEVVVLEVRSGQAEPEPPAPVKPRKRREH